MGLDYKLISMEEVKMELVEVMCGAAVDLKDFILLVPN